MASHTELFLETEETTAPDVVRIAEPEARPLPFSFAKRFLSSGNIL